MSQTQPGKMPGFLLLLSFVELWERFSYYGMRALLVLYLVQKLGFSDGNAYAVYGLFASVGYAGCLAFGILADKFFGPKYLVFVGGSIMLIGHTVMALTELYPELIYLGLSCIAVGTGAFKGNMTNMLGICYDKRNLPQANGYVVFYVAVNIGGALAAAVCGTIGTKIGWHYGFGVAGIGMAIGLITFWIFNKKILNDIGEAPKHASIKKINIAKYAFLGIATVLVGLISFALNNPTEFMIFFKAAGPIAVLYYLYIIVKSDAKYKTNLSILGLLLIFQMIFYALEMQLAGLITLFASRNVDLNMFGYEISSATINAINPLAIIIFGIIVSVLFKAKDKGEEYKFLFGIACIPLCFVVLYFGCMMAQGGLVSFSYLVIGLVIMAIGEIYVGPYVQSQASILAPKEQRGFIFGFTMLSLTFSNIIGAIAAQYMSVDSSDDILNPVLSLEIYKNGFEKIILINIFVVLMFLMLIPIIKRKTQSAK